MSDVSTAPTASADDVLERERQLAAIDHALAAAARGEGGLLVLEGAAGIGKSRLLREARARARGLGFLDLTARGDELERDFSCGVALQLFGPAPLAELLAVPAPAHDPPAAAGDHALLHGLFMRAVDLAEGRPAAILVDDAQWADAPSLRFLCYLATRLEELPLAVLVSHRPAESGEVSQELLSHLQRMPVARVERLRPLGPAAVAAIVRAHLGPDAGEPVCEACAALTGGNPFYLHELLVALREGGTPLRELSPERLREVTPASISRAVLARAAGLPEGAARLAQAVAILGADVPLRHAAALAGLTQEQALRAVDALASVEILAPGEPLAFMHPLVAHAVAADMSHGARAAQHLRAAGLLAAEEAEPERIGAHLLHVPPRADPWAVEVLRAAAAKASSRGGAESAVRLLERALAEPPPPEARADVLVELGHAEAAAARAGAPERFAAALERVADPRRRADIHLARGRALYVQGRHREAAAAFDAGLAELDGSRRHELASELQAGYVAAATIDPALRAEALARADRLVDGLRAPRTAGERALLAQAALHRALAAVPRADVRDLALRAWGDGALLDDETAAGITWTLVTGALDFTDELEHALAVCDAALEDARLRGSPLAFATASYERSIPLYHMGRIAEAAADAQAAVEATRYGWQMYARSAAYTLALCQIELDELDRAEETLAILEDEPPGSSIEHPALLDARAILRRRQGRPEESLADHLEAGRLFTEVFGVLTTGDVDWRLGAAEAALALGDTERAQALAAEGLAFSRAVGLTRGVVGALRVLGLATGGDDGLALLEEAVRHPDPAPARLEHMRALVDHGAALRRANRRSECQGPLRSALELATSRGATALAARARVELQATGARPRRAMRRGAESLTPSERRIAALAASGATNREIAQSLFVTPKTVEYHLRNVFQKLGARSRRELGDLLQAKP